MLSQPNTHRGRWTGKWRERTNTPLPLTCTPFFGSSSSDPVVQAVRTACGTPRAAFGRQRCEKERDRCAPTRLHSSTHHNAGSTLCQKAAVHDVALRERPLICFTLQTPVIHRSPPAWEQRARNALVTPLLLCHSLVLGLFWKKKRPGMGATFELCHRRQ